MFAGVIIFFATVLGYFAYWYIEQKRRYRSLDKLPGPPGWPIIGSALEFGFNPTDIYRAFMRLTNEYGNTYKLWLGPNKCYVMTADPELMEFILSSPKYSFKSADYDLLKPLLSNGLLLSNGTSWQKRRKMINPTFHFKILEDFAKIFLSQTETFVVRLSEKVGKGVFNIYPYITDYTLDTICETAMGTTVGIQKSPENEYARSVRGLSHIIISRIFSAWKQFHLLYMFTNEWKLQKQYINILRGFTTRVIEKRRDELVVQKITGVNTETDEFGLKKKVTFLDVLLKCTVDGKPLSNEDIREEVDTFMVAGHDTTSSALSFIFYLLANHPEVQDKVVEELHELFGNDKNRQLSSTDLNNMKYSEAVIKETLRLYPSVPFFARELREDVQFKDVCLPKGVQIFMVLISLHRRADLFDEPDTFKPERFLMSSGNTRNPIGYLPFSAGDRNCIGQKFAMKEIKVVMYKMLSNFELISAGKKYNVIPTAEITVKSANGINVQLKNRNF